ncbi:MAG: ethanolamine utilization protein EutH [Firmicutes bacterium]|nr:ethanolamine utilization protein EutH [Bacillota bacterium]
MNGALMWIVSAGIVLGGLDRILGNRWGLGARFEEGFQLLGPTAFSMAGILCLTGLLSGGMGEGAKAFFSGIGLDPSMLSSFLAIDMGGYHLAKALQIDPLIGTYAGLVPTATLGCSLVFTIPVGSQILQKEDQPSFAVGMAIGMVTLPFALILGGLLFSLSFLTVLKQNLALIILSLLLGLLLYRIPEKMIKGFQVLTVLLKIILTVGLVLGAVKQLTGAAFLPKLMPLPEAMAVVCQVCVFLLGALPLTELLQRALKKPLSLLGKKLGMNDTSMMALLVGLVSAIPVLSLVKNMDRRGKIVNIAALFCSTAMFGAHIGFVSGVEPDYTLALILSKCAGAIAAVLLAVLFTRKKD